MIFADGSGARRWVAVLIRLSSCFKAPNLEFQPLAMTFSFCAVDLFTLIRENVAPVAYSTRRNVFSLHALFSQRGIKPASQLAYRCRTLLLPGLQP